MGSHLWEATETGSGEKSGLADKQGWNFCIFGEPGSEPKKIKELKKTRSKTRGKGRKRKRGGEKEKRG